MEPRVLERVEARGCPHCAGREIVGWGRSHGLLRFRCKSCGRTFNGLTKTPMARLRKKEKWPTHARAMIEGKSLAKTAALCGVHPTTAFRWRHRFLRAPAANKPRSLSGIVEADETFILESFKGRWSDLPRKARKRGGTARHAGLYQDDIPILVARDRSCATFDADVASGRRRFSEPRPRRSSRRAIISSAMAERRSPLSPAEPGFPLPRRAIAGQTGPRGPHLHINNVNAYHSRLKQWLSRFNGVATKNLPNYLDAAAPSKPGATNSNRQTGSKARSEMGPIND